MKPCVSCMKRALCRVPHDMVRFDRVIHWLEEQRRSPLLRDRLHHYVDTENCLVDAGIVEN